MMMPRIFILALLFSTSGVLFATEATFSKDNKHVYLVQWEQSPPRASGECTLIDINLEKHSCTPIDFRKVLLGDHVRDITLSNDGFVLCATKSALWFYDPSKDICTKVLDAPKSVEIEELSYDPVQEIVFAVCWENEKQALYCLLKKGDQWLPVYNRRSPLVDYPVFSNDGHLYFVSRGDLWTGSLIAQTEPTLPALNAFNISSKTPHGWPKSIPVAELSAYRMAPVAYLETANTTSDSSGLHTIAISKNFVYGDYSRIGGSGWGSLIRCKNAAGSGTEGDTQIGREAIPTLESVEKVSDQPYTLCASRDGLLVFYISLHGWHPFLIKEGGKPEQLDLKGLENYL